MNLYWLLPGTFTTVLLLSSPTLAAKLETWRFDRSQNVLEFKTSTVVQPKAELVFNPTRLVIDLPGVQWGRSMSNQKIGGKVREIRIGQVDSQTARIVVEFNPGYTIDPQQVKFAVKKGNSWTVKLPEITSGITAIRPETSNDNNNDPVIEENTSARQIPPSINNSKGGTELETFLVTGDGFFMRTSGNNPEPNIIRSRDRRTIFIDIPNTNLSPNLINRTLVVNKYGVNSIEFTQLSTTPVSVRVLLKVNENTPNFRVSSSSTGLVLLPSRSNTNISEVPNSETISNNENLATIESVELTENDTKLLIKADQNISASSGWDRSSGLFRITITNAKISPTIEDPVINRNNSPLLRIRLQQQPNTVVILLQPASGVSFGSINQIENNLVGLQLQRYTSQIRPPLINPTLPERGQLPDPNEREQPIITPRKPIRKGKLVVLIDPGHGGKDSGAVGIGGLQEKNVILPIGQRIAEILEQNGIQVVMTRNADFFVTLPGRVALAERVNADVFVSIHANSAGASRPEVNGLETYYYYDNSVRLAQLVHNQILRRINVKDRKVRKARFYVVRKTSMPSILVETGFVTGREDAANLRTSAYQNQMAEAIAQGILQYLRSR
ncbi:N-acetylmuramoyl-L-alanine amidase [Anabaena sp. FACHB-1237]|uniref:N-acetylmuramoyl-L-alanine amidase n=1 Tax=Anabaena sp. FACHB-1237 TaxID=2692769 RepID=UPI0016811C57|nr:N-acetylmuramoyl-L-alanine amidase [Anabaena sp. FACHB-1237]MBD2137482.1 N-acetylmuramoyl-L-alanine amidase [Anabaena sp. FACHB-1237]